MEANMNLTNDEKSILNIIFKDVRGTTRNNLLMSLYAAKPVNDGSSDAQAIITLLNDLIIKLNGLEQAEMEKIFKGIPYQLNN